LGIVLIVRIERIGSGPSEGFEGEAAAIPDFAGYLRHKACRAIPNTLGLAFARPTMLESLGGFLRMDSLLHLLDAPESV